MPIETVVIDTVGFIRKLPHHLVASFRSTMEEAVAADLVLHVIDRSHPQFEEQRIVGEAVLRDLGVDPANVLEVYNKSDVADAFGVSGKGVTLSALTGEGVPQLVDAIRNRELARGEVLDLVVPQEEAARVVATLHEVGEIEQQSADGEVVRLSAWVPAAWLPTFSPYVQRRVRTRRTG
jgi:GTP-binding protein HflX